MARGILKQVGGWRWATVAVAICGSVLPLHGQGGATVGRLSITRQVVVTRSTLAAGAEYVPAKNRQGVFTGQGIRTLKRSMAEITFRDTSVLRINERTDLVVQDAPTLRRIRMQGGAVWVRVVRGVNTTVETPTATAVARGTEFVVFVDEEKDTQLVVFEGAVDFTAGGQTISVGAGEMATATAQTAPGGDLSGRLGNATRIPLPQLPEQYGGASEAWWNQIESSAGVLVAPGTLSLAALRASPLTETLGHTAALTGTNFFIANELDRLRLLNLGQREVVPVVQAQITQSPGLTLDEYERRFGTQNAAEHFTIAGEDLTFLQGLEITSVEDMLRALRDNGATVGVVIGFPSRAAPSGIYRPGSITAQRSRDFQLLDRTETSYTVLGAGLLAALAANQGQFSLTVPRLGGAVFGFSSDPALVGGRLELTGTIGKTRYRVESNALEILTGRAEGSYGKADSIAVIEHPVGQGITLFAGRKRFYHGPVFLNQGLTQLIGDRYSGAGARVTRREFEFEAAYIYDTNPEGEGAQEGGLGSFFLKGGGGVVGLHILEATGVNDGHGRTVSFSYPLAPHQVDFYGEVGRGVDRANLQTYGLYFPGLFQRSDIDLFIEYGRHEDLTNVVSVMASKDIVERLNFRAYANIARGRIDTAGVAAIIRFGDK